MFFGPPKVSTRNRISIHSAVFADKMTDTPLYRNISTIVYISYIQLSSSLARSHAEPLHCFLITAPDSVSTHQLVGVGCRHGFGPASASEDDMDDVSTICLGNSRETDQPDSIELDGTGDSARHSGNVTKNKVDYMIHDQREIRMVCNFDITNMILPSGAECLTLTFHCSPIILKQ